MQLQTTHQEENPSSLTYRIKYENRIDLTPNVRTKIALIAQYGKEYGRITRLGKRFHISRTTVYSLRDQLSASISATFEKVPLVTSPCVVLREATIRFILALRLIGRCSLSAISTILQETGHSRQSVGFVSGVLQDIGDKLPQVIDYQGTFNWACDEIYHLGKTPILVTVEPISGAVLQIETFTGQLKTGWLNHWQRLDDKRLKVLTLISDEGWMLRAARMEQEDWDFQPDTFHAVSHRLGIFAKRYAKAAYQAIEDEYARESLCQNTQMPKNLPLYKKQLAKLQSETQIAIEQHDKFNFFYGCILQQFNVFDKNGEARKRSFAEAEVKTAIDCLYELGIPNLDKELKLIDKLLPNLFNFLDKAQQYCQKIVENGLVHTQDLPFWAIAWQYEKRSFKIKNNYSFQKKLRLKSKNGLMELQQISLLSENDFNDLGLTIFAQFDAIIQSSAPVEMFNSFLKPYLNQSRDQLSQQSLNLIMDFYNNHTFKRGKRKGKSPLEILTGKKNEIPWLDKIMDLVRLHNI
jgi:hypothetical protein